MRRGLLLRAAAMTNTTGGSGAVHDDQSGVPTGASSTVEQVATELTPHNQGQVVNHSSASRSIGAVAIRNSPNTDTNEQEERAARALQRLWRSRGKQDSIPTTTKWKDMEIQMSGQVDLGATFMRLYKLTPVLIHGSR